MRSHLKPASLPATLVLLLATVAAAPALAACGDAANGSAGPGLVELGPRYLVVANASFDFQSGSLGAIDLTALTGFGDLAFLHADSVVRASGGMVFAVNRLGADNLQRFTPDTLATLWQYSVGPGSNPQDVLVLDDHRALVTRYDAPELWVVDVTATNDASFHLGTVDLSPFADADGIPEMGPIAAVGSRIYVALQRLDRQAGFAPTNDGLIVALDPVSTDLLDLEPSTAALDGLRTPTPNPSALEAAGTELWVACAGFHGQLDGALERLDTTTGDWLAPLVTESQLGGDLSAFAPGDPTVVLWTDDRFETHAALFDPLTGAERARLADALSSVQDVAADQTRVYLVDRDPSHPGVRVFSRTTGAELTTEPISTGLPPWSLDLVERDLP